MTSVALELSLSRKLEREDQLTAQTDNTATN